MNAHCFGLIGWHRRLERVRLRYFKLSTLVLEVGDIIQGRGELSVLLLLRLREVILRGVDGLLVDHLDMRVRLEYRFPVGVLYGQRFIFYGLVGLLSRLHIPALSQILILGTLVNEGFCVKIPL